MKLNPLSIIRRKVFNYYNRMPYLVQTTFSKALKVIPPEFVFGADFFKTLNMLKQTEYLHSDILKKIVEKNLSNLLLHAYRSTRYYGDIFQKLGFRETDILKSPIDIISEMPFIDKSIVRENYSLLLSTTKNTSLCDLTSTGGTSGEPFYFHINSNRTTIEWAYIVDQWGRVGFDLKSKRATFRGSPIRKNRRWEDDWLTKERKFSSFELTDKYLDEIWSILCDYSPDFIYAYTSTIISLCRYMERNDKKLPPSIKAILIGSENVYDGQEAYIKKIAQRRVFKWYGHSEKLVLAGECEKTAFYHAYPQYGYVEFVNEKGNPAQPGDFAEIVGTGFINTVLPFIRYRTGDYCTYLGDHCPQCGRNYPIFTDVRGRWTQEVLYGKGGNSICMSAVNVHSDNFKNVFRYQFYQDTPGRAILKIMATSHFSERERMAILKEFNSKFSGNVEVEAILVNDIPLTKRGKYKFIDQNCPPLPID